MDETFKLLEAFSNRYQEEKEKLPYHINLLDELWANENAHSRILAKLLRYKENNKALFLQDFIHNVCGFKQINIDTLVVQKVDSCGKIDIPIYNNKHFVIIENKINHAVEQNTKEGGQLARYIENVHEKYNRDLENIFVVYTPNWAQEPSNEMWVNRDGHSYKKRFEERYKSASYQNEIYPWLKEQVLPQLRIKDIYLHSAVLQYIDHLEGRFGLRKIEKNMNMKLQEEIKKNLNLNDQDLETSINLLSDAEEKFSKILDIVKYLQKKYYYLNLFKGWKEKLQNDFPTLNSKIVGDNFKIKEDIINLGIKFSINEKNYVVMLECNNVLTDNLYIGIGKHFSSEIKYELDDAISGILENNKLDYRNPDDFWYGWEYTKHNEKTAYEELKQLIKNVIGEPSEHN